MADISHIQAKVYEQTAKRRNGRIVREAGWTVCDRSTGKDLGFTVYPTQEAAEAAIPVLLAQLSDRLDKAAQRDAATAAALATVEQDETGGRGYRTVHNGAFGEGRIYHDQPGATQYDSDGSGRYSTQIWDND
jgi:hypothetical protein